MDEIDESQEVGGRDGLWLSVSEIARRKCISKSALSRRVSRLEEQGLLETRPGPRCNVKLINLAALDRLCDETTDLAREMNGVADDRRRRDPNDPSFIYTQEQARKAAYDADLKKLELDERLGRLLPIEDLEIAAATTAETIVQILNSLPSMTDEIMAMARTSDTARLRQLLKKIVFDVRTALAHGMRDLAHSGYASGD